MKLEKWALIAEVISGVGVLITLILLLVGMRENTAVNRVIAYNGIMDSRAQQRRAFVEDEELARLGMSLSTDPSEFSEVDNYRRYNMIAGILEISQKAYFARQADILGDSEWDNTIGDACFFFGAAGTGLTAQGYSSLRATLTEEFVDFLQQNC